MTSATFIMYVTASQTWEAVNFEVFPEEGFWFDAPSSAPSTRDIAFVGDIVHDEEITVPIVEGVNLVAYPFSSPVSIQDMNFAESGATGKSNGAKDIINIWDRDAEEYVRFGLDSDGKWYYMGSGQWSWANPKTEVVYVFEPGESFMYTARDDFTWTVDNPYVSVFAGP